MGRSVRYGIAIIALAVSGWSSASTLDVSELCGRFELLEDPEARAYRGQFEDRKGVALDHALIVIQVTDAGKALVFYVHGKQPKWNIRRPGCSPRIGKSTTTR